MSGCAQNLRHLDDLPDVIHVTESTSATRPAAAGVRLHARGAQAPVDPMARPGARLLARWAPTRRWPCCSNRPKAAVRLLPAALRPGHQPAARRHPRGAGDVAGEGHRAGGQPSARPTRPACSRSRGPSSTTTSSTSSSTSRKPASAGRPARSRASIPWPRGDGPPRRPRAASGRGVRPRPSRPRASQSSDPLRLGVDRLSGAHSRRCSLPAAASTTT